MSSCFLIYWFQKFDTWLPLGELFYQQPWEMINAVILVIKAGLSLTYWGFVSDQHSWRQVTSNLNTKDQWLPLKKLESHRWMLNLCLSSWWYHCVNESSQHNYPYSQYVSMGQRRNLNGFCSNCCNSYLMRKPAHLRNANTVYRHMKHERVITIIRCMDLSNPSAYSEQKCIVTSLQYLSSPMIWEYLYFTWVGKNLSTVHFWLHFICWVNSFTLFSIFNLQHSYK